MSFLRRMLSGWNFDAEREAEGVTGDPERVQDVLTVLAEVRPYLAADGGDVQLVSVTDDGWVELRFLGACTRCTASLQTLHGMLEPVLRSRHPWVAGVRQFGA